jgi:MPBQ/MSBQ methyltransferase
MNTMLIDSALHNRILQYYVDAGLDYAFWSKGFNMHFGLGDLRTVFSRERMLNQMSAEVLRRVLPSCHGHIADFGCGVGATMRAAAHISKDIRVTGLTIVPWQKEKGDELNESWKSQLEIRVEDYHNSSLDENSCDGVYAIESACYSPEKMHLDFFSEIHRVLRPGGRVVIADGFLKVSENELGTMVRTMYNGICKNWALPGMMNINDVKDHLINSGFKNISMEEVSWKVAPSVLHVPFVIIWFLMYKKLMRQKLSHQSIRNLKGSLQTLLLGLQRASLGYYLVTAEK